MGERKHPGYFSVISWSLFFEISVRGYIKVKGRELLLFKFEVT